MIEWRQAWKMPCRHFYFYKGDGKREEDRTANGADARVVG